MEIIAETLKCLAIFSLGYFFTTFSFMLNDYFNVINRRK